MFVVFCDFSSLEKQTFELGLALASLSAAIPSTWVKIWVGEFEV